MFKVTDDIPAMAATTQPSTQPTRPEGLPADATWNGALGRWVNAAGKPLKWIP